MATTLLSQGNQMRLPQPSRNFKEKGKYAGTVLINSTSSTTGLRCVTCLELAGYYRDHILGTGELLSLSLC